MTTLTVTGKRLATAVSGDSYPNTGDIPPCLGSPSDGLGEAPTLLI